MNKFKFSKRQVWILRSMLAFIFVLYYFCLPRTLFTAPLSTVVIDKKGVLLGARIATDGQWRFPETNQVPDKLKRCMIAFEDDYFYYHWGVNPISICKAFVTNIKAKRVLRGGSTITMQVIRLSRKEARTVTEKIIEAILATRLEFRYSKDKILNLYASYAPFGGNVVGYNAAAWRYFGHDAKDLSWGEAATLAVLPNSPSSIHLSRGRSLLLKKRNNLLKKLFKKGVFDSQTLELALEEPLPNEPSSLPQIAPHLVSKLAEMYPGKQVISTVNSSIQQRVEEVANRWNSEYIKHNIRDIAVIVIDVESSEVIAYHGNSGFKSNQYASQVNIIDAPRSTGSILKPFLFASMIDEGILLPKELVPDIPMNIKGFSPQNFNLRYEGAVSADEALSRSLNLPSVFLLKEYTVPKFYLGLKDLGFTTLTAGSEHYGLSLILGGAEGKLHEIADAYLYLVQQAKEVDCIPSSIVVGEKKNKIEPPFGSGAAWQVLQMLTEVNRPGEIAWKRISSMQNIAWKTGTSQGFRDAWAVGGNQKYVIGVWVGNASGDGNPDLIGGRVAGPVMFDLFNIFPNQEWMPAPKNTFVDAEVCHQSGLMKSRFCVDIDTILVVPNALENAKVCPYHQLITLTEDGKQRVYKSCEGLMSTIQKSWFTLPPIWEWYYKKYHPEYEELPPFKRGCGSDYMRVLQFIYPTPGANLVVTKQFEGNYGAIVFELAHTDMDAKVFWHLDGEYIGTTTLIHKMEIVPEDGNHVMTAVDTKGNTASVRFSTKKTIR